MTAKTWRTYVSALFELVLAAGATLVFSGASHAAPEYPPGVPPPTEVTTPPVTETTPPTTTTTTTTTSSDLPNSGFQASNLLWAGLALVAVGGLATFLVRRGRSS